jgi:hypothetical protein
MKFPFKMDLAMRTARALIAPSPPVASTPAVTSLPDPHEQVPDERSESVLDAAAVFDGNDPGMTLSTVRSVLNRE